MNSTVRRSPLLFSMTTPSILKGLLEEGLITTETFTQLQRRFGSGTGNMMVRLAQAQIKSIKGTPITLDQLTELAARRAGLEYIKIDPLKVNVKQATSTMSGAFAKHHKILPIELTENHIKVAVGDIHHDAAWVEMLQQNLKRTVTIVLANPFDIERYQHEFFLVAKSVKHAQRPTTGSTNFEQLVDINALGQNPNPEDNGIINIVDWLWQYAFQQRASDIHLEPRREIGAIRFRIDGVLHTVYQVPLQVLSAMTSRIKSLGRMDIVEKRRPQDGRIKTRGHYGEIEMRLSTLPTAFGEKMVMRIFDPFVTVRTLEELGFPADEAQRWKKLTSKHHGIILVTGPTGSGKTTTLYSTLKRLATDKVNVNTIEDPIEMVEASFNQSQVQSSIGFTFAEGLRSLLRQDPDIIMVGEIRDLPTAEMAIQAALTGHLVVSTMHTNDAPSAVSRLVELGVPPYLISASLIGVLAQRLVRVLCPVCKAPDPDADIVIVQKMGLPVETDYTPYKPIGCDHCRNTGFKGRVGVYELLALSEAFKSQIHVSPDLAKLRAQGITDGMTPLRRAGLELHARGLTTLEEVVDATPDMT